MKSLILLLFLFFSAAPIQAGWFDREERQRRIEAEHQLQQQRTSTTHWQVTSGILGITCVVLLIVGAAIGAKARKEVGHGK